MSSIKLRRKKIQIDTVSPQVMKAESSVATGDAIKYQSWQQKNKTTNSTLSIQILKQGLFDTLQDAGRYGYQHLGINPGGVMDEVAASVANMLVGNKQSEAVIEFHFPASVLLFEKPCLIALSGADFTATVNDETIPLNTAIIVTANSVLAFKAYKKGARCYLAVQGGFNANFWLNSYSTNAKIKAGGFAGRALQKNDVIHLRASQFEWEKLPAKNCIITNIQADCSRFYNPKNIRCIEGNEFIFLNESSKKKFAENAFTISAQSDRMGFRLKGVALEKENTDELISTAVTKGTIQLLPDGMLIALMADHQTTGGYPRIAHIISADIPAVAQMQPGSIIHFEFIKLEEAQEIFIQQQQDLLQVQKNCTKQLQKFFSNGNY